MPDTKPVGAHPIPQSIETKLEEGKLEIIFQMTIDNQGNTSITVFKNQQDTAPDAVKKADANPGGGTAGNP